jgi:predicted NBD/HSP70 family sugar kinase
MHIGIDIGGTNIRIAGSETIDNPKLIEKLIFPNTPDYAQDEQAVIRAMRQFGQKVDSIGISTMGRLDDAKTIVLSASAAPQWVNQPFAANLRTEFDCPVMLNGDQYCAALSEAMVQKRRDNFVCIVYGTGIGAAIVECNEVPPKVRTIEYDKHIQYLRPWQFDCGGKWVREQYGKPLEDLSESEWAGVMDKFYNHLLRFIRELHPPRLVFGGGVAVKQWPRLQAVSDRLRRENNELQDFEISLVRYGEDAGLIGALMLPQQ